LTVEVSGLRPEAARGIGDFRLRHEQLTASPRQHTSELLSAAPGFFVDHEDGEGLGNDVYLRGFDLDHGSGIEMRVGGVPINAPVHVRGQGYADVDFIIPEVVDAIRVQEGPYDPRQGDAAIVGSAAFALGVRERGYQLKASYGSFNQRRILAIVAPAELDSSSFIAFAARRTDGFGARRAGVSGAVNAQYTLELGPFSALRLLTTAHGAQSDLPGVVREEDVDAGRIGLYDSYPFFANSQAVDSRRVIIAVELSRRDEKSVFVVAPWFQWTDLRARQNYSGAIESSQIEPSLSGLGDLFETTNRESAAGVTASFRARTARPGVPTRAMIELGASARYGLTEQTKSLLRPDDRLAWDRRLEAHVGSLDAAAYLDVELDVAETVRLLGGPRVDLLGVSVDDRLTNRVPPVHEDALPGSRRSALALAVSPRVVLEYAPAPALAALVAYGEGFRSLDASRLRDGADPYSKVRSFEAGVRAQDARRRFTSSVSVFQTHVGNELVFVAEEGGLEMQKASTRRGVIASVVATPRPWLLASVALSVVSARFDTHVVGVSHYVPNVPPLLARADVSARGSIGRLENKTLNARAGVGYTFMSGRHLSDAVIGPSANVLNVGAALRYDFVELALDVYNALGLEYADNADLYVSNWSFQPGQQRAALGTHLTAAPPRTLLGSLSLYF
jgi:hypothetical protein